MHRAKIAVCIRDREYRNRFVSCLMKHYRNQVELHIFDGEEETPDQFGNSYELYLVSGEDAWMQELSGQGPVVCLWDRSEECNIKGGEMCSEKENVRRNRDRKEGDDRQVYFVDKYQNVARIMEEVLSHITADERDGYQERNGMEKTKLMAVYSLSAVECQLPFAVTLGTILADNQRVLLVDLQESSGISQILSQESSMGLEEMLLMAESGNFHRGRMASCIGHRNGMDYIYPAASADSFYEVGREGYLKLFAMLSREMDYEVIVINFGTRFPGFLETLSLCSPVYLIHSAGQIHKWREREFLSEIEAKGYQGMVDAITHVEMPLMVNSVTSMERLVEEWKWGNLGDIIRRMTTGAAANG